LNHNLVDQMKQMDIKDNNNLSQDNDNQKRNQQQRTTPGRRTQRKTIYDDFDSGEDDFFIADDESSFSMHDEESSGDSVFDLTPVKKPTEATTKRQPTSTPSKTNNTTAKALSLTAPPKKPPTMSARAFKQKRESLAEEYFIEYNRVAFDGKLSSIQLVWSNKLQTTAGLTRLVTISIGKNEQRKEAKIELNTKVLDEEEKLQSTLLHEMCHAAAWLLDGVAKPPHGKCFKKWSTLAMKKVSNNEQTCIYGKAYPVKLLDCLGLTNPLSAFCGGCSCIYRMMSGSWGCCHNNTYL
jgi:hypothetical protein